MDELDAADIEWRQLEDDLRLVRWRAERLIAVGYELGRAAFSRSPGSTSTSSSD